jgi:O-antigen ligase
MDVNSKPHWWQKKVANLSAFLVPGVALCIPSGYSYGAVLLLVGALLSVQSWRRLTFSKDTWLLVAMYLAMAFIWAMDVGVAWGWGSFDRVSKYLLAVPCVFFLMAFSPHPAWLWMGIASGAISSGAVALYQIYVSGMGRATGFTNAIQYGNLSLLMATMSAVALIVLWRSWRVWQRCFFAIAIPFGMLASLLSQSRGGWLALVLLLPIAAWLLTRILSWRWVLLFSSALLACLLFAAQTKFIESRIERARVEMQLFQKSGDASNSVGQRLAHWQLAFQMGLDKPLFGWGRDGYIAEKARRVDLGLAHPSVKDFGHVHNEVLELFVKRGVLGVFFLLAFYLIPLVIFWPTGRRICREDGSFDPAAAALRVVGILIPLFYAGFGLTQVFLAHNSGNMFYLFMCPLVLAALEQQHNNRVAFDDKPPGNRL